MTTKIETIANIGDIIKAYDFQPREQVGERYLLGRVIDKGWIAEAGMQGYTVEVVGQSDSNMEDNIYTVTETAYVPYKTMFDFEGRVSVKEAA